MSSGVRKLYLEIPSDKKLKERVASLEARVKSLNKDNSRLMDKCEANMAASTKHAANERDARQEADRLKGEIASLRLKYNTLKEQQEYVTLAISIYKLPSLLFSFLQRYSRTCG